MALEIAMDEMAEALGQDPVAFRILNDTQVDPEKPERAFSHRNLIGCLQRGSDTFGWSRRNPRPAQVRDGRWLVGMGVAAGFRNNLLMKSAARVEVTRDGRVGRLHRHDRYRHRQLHHHRPDGGGNAGRAAGSP